MFDVIIATYNRFEKAKQLALSLVAISDEHIRQVFIVDSTENQMLHNTESSKIIHQVTNHKNQPLQRYLGYLKSKAPYLLFLDDDMEVADKECFEKIKNRLNVNVIGLAIYFIDKHTDTSLSRIEKSIFSGKSSRLKKWWNWFTAYPMLKPGRFGLCGVRGPQPKEGGLTTFVSGGAFVAKREFIYQNFNFNLFDLYNNKLGKGEDAIIGYTLSKQGDLVYLPDLLFYHNDQKDSAYSIDLFSFAKRVTFSRLYLSQERTRLNNENQFYAKIHFHWHTFWRVSGLGINYLLNRNVNRKHMFMGSLVGWKLALAFKFSFKPNLEVI